MAKLFDRNTFDRLKARTQQKPGWFVGLVQGAIARAGWPFQRQISWKERALDEVGGEFTLDLTRTSAEGANQYAHPATYLAPPACMMLSARAHNGEKLYGYQPTVHVMVGTVVSVVGSINAFYTVRNLDGAIQAANVTPLDRWQGVTYVAKPINSTVLMLVSSADELRILAFETPQFATCP